MEAEGRLFGGCGEAKPPHGHRQGSSAVISLSCLSEWSNVLVISVIVMLFLKQILRLPVDQDSKAGREQGWQRRQRARLDRQSETEHRELFRIFMSTSISTDCQSTVPPPPRPSTRFLFNHDIWGRGVLYPFVLHPGVRPFGHLVRLLYW